MNYWCLLKCLIYNFVYIIGIGPEKVHIKKGVFFFNYMFFGVKNKNLKSMFGGRI